MQNVLTNNGSTIKLYRMEQQLQLHGLTKYFWSQLAKIRGKEEVN